MKKRSNYTLKSQNLILSRIKDCNKILLKIQIFSRYFLFNKKSINVFLCLNNYSYYLARSYVNQHQRSFNLIFYTQDRTKIYKKFSNIFFVNYKSIFNRIILLLICLRVDQENIFLPHNSGGSIQRFISRNFKFSILEDGLDSYRESPNNIKISSLVNNQKIIMPFSLRNIMVYGLIHLKKNI